MTAHIAQDALEAVPALNDPCSPPRSLTGPHSPDLMDLFRSRRRTRKSAWRTR